MPRLLSKCVLPGWPFQSVFSAVIPCRSISRTCKTPVLLLGKWTLKLLKTKQNKKNEIISWMLLYCFIHRRNQLQTDGGINNCRAEPPKPPRLLQVWQNNSRSQWLVSDAVPCTAAAVLRWEAQCSSPRSHVSRDTSQQLCWMPQSTTGYRGLYYCHPTTGNCTAGELAAPGLMLDIPDFPWNQNDNEFENELSNTTALLKPDKLSFGFVTLLFQLVLE